jgi:hypothetical protein
MKTGCPPTSPNTNELRPALVKLLLRTISYASVKWAPHVYAQWAEALGVT